MGSDGLEVLLGKTGYQALLSIGYMRDYIKYRIEKGYKFKLVIFKEDTKVKLATWDKMHELIAEIYPDIENKVFIKLSELKNTPFSDIEQEAGWKFNQVDKSGISNPKFMTYERFKDSEGTLVDVRSFLYHTVHLRELFSGDGYTYNEAGERGLKEYIAPNRKIEELEEYRIIDISIKIP